MFVQYEVATFSGDCFWGVEYIFLTQCPPAGNGGILKTCVGYTGGKGSSINPSYQEVCTGNTEHAEAIRIEFDPSVVSYAELAEFFYRTHDQTTLNKQGRSEGTEYRSTIFTHSSEQRAIAERVTEEVTSKHFTSDRRITTQIKDAGQNPTGYHCPTHRLHW